MKRNESVKMTHAECVKHSERIARRLGFPLVISEMKAATGSGEIPDVIAFAGGARSLLIECKVSKADFLADKEKPFRKQPWLGMGLHRIYVMPEGILKRNELDLLPEDWHLIVIDNDVKPIWGTMETCANMSLCKTYRNKKTGKPITPFYERNVYDENAVLYSYIRRRGIR